ncbi:ATP-binding cassette domain-containing protein [Methylotuvimicrobium alcaliphilum]|uniref:ABC transporter, ATP-binding protein n=1 Tax=Methylotuvimicrobium alcaliphilum (strain DSM 19304 / NCIMB 14124 / VKM B-2133 / 20Z) TaxID=1091494 RepID=G4SU06_META2|nr:ABC transporter ATP-binding protein [Methylotuvimicrobium alcaliphilum]CCE22829.1 ABC transporter, ATP-binding protein [Methylotuvimicrobium alcaliphilum 20Z]
MTDLYRLNDIRFLYVDKVALTLPSLSVKTGKITALIGPNGCGKSTLLNMLAFLDSPQQGSINFKGETVRTKKQLQALRKRVGLLTQKPYMLRGTVADNLKLALKLHSVPKLLWQNKINEVLNRLDAIHLLNQQANTLSGGQLQKAALARALINDPEVLLLDEPFSYLDQAANNMLEEFIQDYSASTRNLIFSTHNRLQGLALADEVITLINGSQVQTPLLNLFHGHLDNHIFNTGKLSVVLTGDIEGCRHISIDPHEIVLSKEPFCSSIRNQYPGRVTSISEEMGKVRVNISAGEIFQALITFEALHDLKLQLGDEVWVNFKSNSIVTF